LLAQVDQVVIQHIYREANMAADWLAKYGHSVSGTIVTIEIGNPDFQRIVCDDMLCRTLARRGA